MRTPAAALSPEGQRLTEAMRARSDAYFARVTAELAQRSAAVTAPDEPLSSGSQGSGASSAASVGGDQVPA